MERAAGNDAPNTRGMLMRLPGRGWRSRRDRRLLDRVSGRCAARFHDRIPSRGIRRPSRGVLRCHWRGRGGGAGRPRAAFVPAVPSDQTLLLPDRRRGAPRAVAARRAEPAGHAVSRATERRDGTDGGSRARPGRRGGAPDRHGRRPGARRLRAGIPPCGCGESRLHADARRVARRGHTRRGEPSRGRHGGRSLGWPLVT